MSNDEVLLTKNGLKKLQDRLEYLKNVARPACTEKISFARSLGDLSENSEYSAAKEEQSIIEGEVMEIEEKLRKVKMISSRVDTTKVSVGATVRVHDMSFDEDIEYRIVGSTESDPLNGLLSNDSPAGRALLGAKVGDIVSYESINSGKIKMKVLEITD